MLVCLAAARCRVCPVRRPAASLTQTLLLAAPAREPPVSEQLLLLWLLCDTGVRPWMQWLLRACCGMLPETLAHDSSLTGLWAAVVHAVPAAQTPAARPSPRRVRCGRGATMRAARWGTLPRCASSYPARWSSPRRWCRSGPGRAQRAGSRCSQHAFTRPIGASHLALLALACQARQEPAAAAL